MIVIRHSSISLSFALFWFCVQNQNQVCLFNWLNLTFALYFSFALFDNKKRRMIPRPFLSAGMEWGHRYDVTGTPKHRFNFDDR